MPGHSGPQVVHDPDAQFNLKNAHGMEVRLASYGARITSIKVPDRNGVMADIVLGFDTVETYRSSVKKPYLGGDPRPIRRAHRRWAVHSGRRRACAREEQRSESQPWWGHRV